MSQKYCTSCGSPIPDGQGTSCSMCYGDIDHGSDGYYRREMERDEDRQQEHEPDDYDSIQGELIR